MLVRSVSIVVGCCILSSDVPNGVVIIIVTVRSANCIEPVQFIIGIVRYLTARCIIDLADVAIVLIGIGQVEKRTGWRSSTGSGTCGAHLPRARVPWSVSQMGTDLLTNSCKSV